MATSGSINYTVTRDQIITEALEQLSVIGAGETPTSNDVDSCSRTLNMMIKAWQADDIDITTVSRRYLFIESGTNEYIVNGTSVSRFTNTYVHDAIDGAVSSGASSIVVDDGSLANNGDRIGVYQSDGTMHWTIINAVLGTTLGLTIPLTADVDDGAVVYYFTNISNRPIEIVDAYIRNYAKNDRPIKMISRKDWGELSNKTNSGSIVQIYYDAQISNTTEGRDPTIFLWSAPSDPRDIVVVWVKRTVEDFDSASDTPDFPQEYMLPLAFNLAKAIASKFGVPTRDQNYANIVKIADEWYYKVKNYWSRPQGGIRFQPDRRR